MSQPPGPGKGGQHFWQALTDQERWEMRRAGTVRSRPGGTVLIHEGDPANVVMIILRGSVKIITISAGGHERMLAVRGEGEFIGEMALWQAPRSATVQAIDEVELLAIPRDAFVRILQHSHTTALELMRVLGERRRAADQERTEFGGSTVAQRVTSVLTDLALQYRPGADGAISLPLTQEELASLAAASRSGVARTLAALREQKIIATAPRQITLLDPAALRDSFLNPP